MGRELKDIEIDSMKRAVILAEKENVEHEFKIDLKQLQIDRGLDVNYAIKKRELSAEIIKLQGNVDFNNTIIEKYSQCIETGHVEIDVEEDIEEDLDTENN